MAEKKEKFLEITIERGVSFRVLGFIGLREDGVRIVNEQRAEKFSNGGYFEALCFVRFDANVRAF